MKSFTSLISPVGVGIDFGTYKSAIAFMGLEHKEPELVRIDPSNTDDPYRAMSLPTRFSLSVNPHNQRLNIEMDDGRYQDLPNQKKDGIYVATQFKMRMGGNWNTEESGEILETLKRPISVLGLAGKILDTLNSSFRSQLKQRYWATRTKQYVITVPPSWDYLQRNATIHASRLSDIKDSRLIEEPLAAAIYLINNGFYDPRRSNVTLVVDFGAGTCDVALLEWDGKGLLVVDKDTIQYGGMDIDKALLKGLLSHPENSAYQYENKALSNNAKPVEHLDFMAILGRIVELKHEFGKQEGILHFEQHAKFSNFKVEMSADEFKTIIDAELKENIDGRISSFLRNYETSVREIRQVFVVGGSSQLLGFRDRIGDLVREVGKTALRPEVPVIPSPEWCVAKGAAILSLRDMRPPFVVPSKRLPTIEYDREDLQLLSGDIPSGGVTNLPVRSLLVFKVKRDLERIIFEIFADGERTPRDTFTVNPKHDKKFMPGSRIALEYEVDIDNLLRLKPQVLHPRQKILYSNKVFHLDMDETMFRQEYHIKGAAT